jgi:2-amino-4-hydroxy-6-hydroxymethyldihydropteridine diphosphokinase/CDP-diacylglycerol--serine O-phosphatidyltransferase
MNQMNRLTLLPNLFTLGNGICGFLAILYAGLYAIGIPQADGKFAHDFSHIVTAGWLILLGMVFDGVDGRIARMTGGTSRFGAELDSLCDAITFGIAPAFLVAILNTGNREQAYWEKVVWIIAVAYASCAILRLARYNVEQSNPDESTHLSFKGAPSPAAGGTIASLVILIGYLRGPRVEKLYMVEKLYIWDWLGPNFAAASADFLEAALPFIAAVLAYLMVSSRIYYVHFLNSFFRGKRTFDYLSYMIFGGLVVFMFQEITLVLIFAGYMSSGIVVYAWREILWRGRYKKKEDTLPDHPNVVLIGLGSNMGARGRNLRAAVRRLDANRAITVTRRSRFYKTKAVGGPRKQRAFLNGAAVVQTSLTPLELLEAVLEVEDDMGRIRGERWGPRVIDIDILLYGNLVIRDENLIVPHPRMHERRFVLEPANDIAPELVHPVLKQTIQELFEAVAKTKSTQIIKIGM